MTCHTNSSLIRSLVACVLLAAAYLVPLPADDCLAAYVAGATTSPAASAAPSSEAATVSVSTDDTDDDKSYDFESPRIRVRKGIGKIRFRYRDDGFEQVSIQGSFNDWQPESMQLDAAGEIWSFVVDLDPGRYRYQYLVRDEGGEWTAIDPNNSHATRDSRHGWVSKFRVSTKKSDRRSRRHRDRSVGSHIARNELDRLYGDDGGASYDRVDGLAIHAVPEDIGHSRFEPSLAARVKYGFKSKEWSLSGTMAQPLLRNGRLLLMFSVYSETAYTDQTGVGDVENSLAAAFFKEDFRDYYWREGLTSSIIYRPNRDLRLQAGFHSADYTSLTNHATWSLASGSFLPNPAIHRGNLRSLFARGRWGDADNHLDLHYEKSGEGAGGGEFDFEQLTAQVRSRVWLGPDKHFDFRIKAGSTLSGWLPNQRRYLVGGLGTVRGYRYQTLLIPDPGDPADADPPIHGGQKMLIANAEYTLHTDWDFDLILFADTGMAWADRDAEFNTGDLHSSAGIGFQIDDDDDGLRVDVIQTLDESGRDTLCQLRLRRMF